MIVWAAARDRGPETLAAYQEKSREMLSALRAIHPGFQRLLALGDTPMDVPADLEQLDTLIATQAFDGQHPEDYLDLGEDGRLAPKSRSLIGFSVSYMSLADRAPSSDEGTVTLTLRGRSATANSTSNVTARFTGAALATFGERRLVRAILEQIAMIWGCTLGGVYCARYRQTIKGHAPASCAGQWLYYLPFPHLARCLPPDIRHEPFANGILIETTPHMPDASNPADIAAGQRVRDVLDEFGLVNHATYAIEGWPPDREEALYEQFITGVPPDRKYTVHCIDFDGYDAERKVLLYAKLFRRLQRHPKEWGLRGWDGPVLNEARRQVRAAAKAGGVPIEWHIGLEEPAHQVRQLLADYTDITEQQLRVIYTPLERALKSPPS